MFASFFTIIPMPVINRNTNELPAMETMARIRGEKLFFFMPIDYKINVKLYFLNKKFFFMPVDYNKNIKMYFLYEKLFNLFLERLEST